MNTLRLRRSEYWISSVVDGDITVTSALTSGVSYVISVADLQLLSQIATDEYTEVVLSTQQETDTYGRLAQAGTLVLHLDQEPYTSMRELDEKLTDQGWPVSAAIWAAQSEDLHITEQQRQPRKYDDARKGSAEAFRKLRDENQFPPTFPIVRDDQPVITLPNTQPPPADLHQVLLNRRSFRYFTEDHVPLDALASILNTTFGCQKLFSTTGEPIAFTIGQNGNLTIADDGTLVQMRSFPSGGSRHPINTRVLVNRVEGLESGIYLYHPLYRTLQLERAIPHDRVKPTALRIAANQSWAGDAALLLLYTLSVKRHWAKYRGVNRGLTAMFMEVGAAQTTVYYTVEAHGLACNFTAMLDAHFTHDLLELDGIAEKAVGITAVALPDMAMKEEMERENAGSFLSAAA